MSSNILLEDDDDAMFGDGDEEEEEDVDVMAPPLPAAAINNAAVKKEDPPPAEDASETKIKVETNGGKVDGKAEGGTTGASEGVDTAAAAAARPPPSDTPPPPPAPAAAHAPPSPLLLPTTLPSASPFPHHNAGPSADRLRNALSRVTADPTRDAEAWRALITEAQSCYRQLLPQLHKHKLKNAGTKVEGGHDADSELLGRKLDWIEACYGALLHHFPYAVAHYVQLAEILLRLGALTQDEEEQCGLTGGMGMMGMLGSTSAVGSALSNTALHTPDEGVAITPASLLMLGSMAASETERQRSCDAKLDRIFQICLGVNLDGSNALHGDIAPGQPIDAECATSIGGARTVAGGLCQHSMDLWLLYIRKRTWNAARASSLRAPIPPPPPLYVPTAAQASVLHQQFEESLRSAYRTRKESIREAVAAAYETALDHGAGFARDNHLIWKRYVNFVKSWTVPVDYSTAVPGLVRWLPPGTDPGLLDVTLPPPDPAHDHTTSQKQLSLLRSVYQRGITHPMTGLDQFWQEYEVFERSHSESLGSVLVAEWLPRYQHARSIYLERNRVWTVHELKVGRLAVPPVERDRWAGGAIGASAGDDGLDAAGSGAAGAPVSEAEYLAQMEEERLALSRWRRRSGYERTNPERLPASDHAARVRAGYREEACTFARHPEVWFEWSQWELLHGGSAAASSSGGSSAAAGGARGGSAASAALIAPATAGDPRSGGNALRAVAVLSLGMESLPDSALLAQAQAEILERYAGGAGGTCVRVLERLVDRSPTTLGFVLLQRLARRHGGIAAARAVFARARRTLLVREEDARSCEDDGGTGSGVASAAPADGAAVEDAAAGPGADSEGKADGGSGEGTGGAAGRQMVTSRVRAPEGDVAGPRASGGANPNTGFITWHLYAAHATIEHRLSKNPHVAARVYELGLRKHRTFLSNPPYVLHYANLLLELNEEENLRSLLIRAVAACEEEETNATGSAAGSDVASMVKRREIQRPLWDMMLKFESTLSSNNAASASDILSIEARRRRALYGPSNEDVVMGGDFPPEEEDDRNLGTGVHKSSLNEQLVRMEGYDVASRIANGMGRMVDVLTVMGAIGEGEATTPPNLDFTTAASALMVGGGFDLRDECAGGPSDVSYVERLRFHREGRARAASSPLGLASAGPGAGLSSAGKLLSFRERAAAGVGGGAAHAQAAGALALQNSPEWLRPLLALLPPVPRFGRAGTVKPPPHLTEMALSALRSNRLPARPVGNSASNGSSKRKRGRGINDGGDSSDEENGKAALRGGGYSNQFRSRQRSRLMASSN